MIYQPPLSRRTRRLQQSPAYQTDPLIRAGFERSLKHKAAHMRKQADTLLELSVEAERLNLPQLANQLAGHAANCKAAEFGIVRFLEVESKEVA